MYRLRDGRSLELIHKTAVGGIPGALVAYKGRLLAGVGNALRIYDMGKKKLLRKTEYRSLPTHIVSLHTMGDRIFVGDQQVRSSPGSENQPISSVQNFRCAPPPPTQ